MPETLHGPLLVLGPHRSGTSAVTGVLATAGLRLGPVLPPGPDNPKGYFESSRIVDLHNAILDSEDRDWTCPPAVSGKRVDLTKLRAAVDELGSTADGPWGVKDPRLLFLLDLWGGFLANARMIGVVRHPLAIARSLEARNGFTSHHAEAIAKTYTNRLAELRRQLPFPILDFDSGRDTLLTRIEAVANALELHWSPSAANDQLSPSLVHHQGDDYDDPDWAYLVEMAGQPIKDVPWFSGDQLADAVLGCDPTSAESLSMEIGPAYSRRRLANWLIAGSLDLEVEQILDLGFDGDGRPIQIPGADAGMTTRRVLANQAAGLPGLKASHIIATGVLDRIPSAKLNDVFLILEDASTHQAVVAMDGLVTEEASLRSRLFWPELAATSQTTGPLFHHHRIVLEAALLGTSWKLAELNSQEGEAAKRTEFLLVKDDRLVSRAPRPLAEVRGELTRLEKEAESTKKAHEAESVRIATDYEASKVALQGELLLETERRKSAETETSALQRSLAAEIENVAIVETRLLEENAAVRKLLTEERKNHAATLDKLEASRRDVSALKAKIGSITRFLPKRLLRSVWYRVGPGRRTPQLPAGKAK